MHIDPPVRVGDSRACTGDHFTALSSRIFAFLKLLVSSSLLWLKTSDPDVLEARKKIVAVDVMGRRSALDR